jgi:hypothetical protein
MLSAGVPGRSACLSDLLHQLRHGTAAVERTRQAVVGNIMFNVHSRRVLVIELPGAQLNANG